MNQDILTYSLNAMRAKWKILSLAGLLLVPIAIIIVRNIKPTFVAASTMLVKTDGLTLDSNPLLNGLMGSMNSMEKDALIMSQEELLVSQEVYKRFQKKKSRAEIDAEIREANTQKNTPIARLKSSLKETLFGNDYLASEQKINNLFFNFRKKIGFESNLDAGTFKVTFKDDTPEAATRGVKRLTEALVAYQADLEKSQSGRVSEFLNTKINETRARLDKVTQQINNFILKNDFPFNGEVVKGILTQLFEGQSRLSEAELELAQVKEEDKLLSEATKETQNKLREKILEGTVNRVRVSVAQITQLESLLSKARLGNKDSVDALEAKISILKSALSTQLERSTQLVPEESLESLLNVIESKLALQKIAAGALTKRVDVAKEHKEQLERQVREFPRMQSELALKLVEQEILSKVISTLSEQQILNSMKQDAYDSKIVTISGPVLVPSILAFSRLRMLIAIYFVLMLVVVAAVIYSLYSKGTIMNPEQLKTIQKDVISGSIPFMPEQGKELSAQIRNASSVARLRRHIENKKNWHSKDKIITFTSLHPHEGKSFTSLVLGTNLAMKGHKVLLVGCDLRKDHGTLSHILAERFEEAVPLSLPKESIIKTSTRLIDCLVLGLNAKTAGSIEDYFRHKFSDELELYADDYDYIILDAPPLGFDECADIIKASRMIFLCLPESESTISSTQYATEIIHQIAPDNADFGLILTRSRSQREDLTARYRGYKYAA